MSLSYQTLLMIVPLLLLIEGFFSGSEIALLSADKLMLRKLARQGNKGARNALDLTKHPERILSTTLLMTSICVISISVLIALYFINKSSGHADLLAVVVTSPVVVIFGELLPKTLYQRHSTKIAPLVAQIVNWTYWAFFPVTILLSSYTVRLAKVIGPIEELLAGKHRTTREELRSLLSYSKRESEIKSSEKKILKRIFDFKDSEAKHALIPLVRVEAIEELTTVREALEKFDRHRHARMPVYSKRVDNIIGVLESADLMIVTDIEQPVRAFISPARYVAETQALDDLLQEMHKEDNEMVVVVDEYGGAVGILTFEDIVEEIVGEISDEFDSDTTLFKTISNSSWLVQARMEVQQVNENLRVDLPSGDYETIGGFLLQQFGRIPEQGDELFFNTPVGLLKFTVKKATERQVEAIQLDIIESKAT
ncbi:MAG: hemolysin family protein [Bdellovibrionota bacterium]